MSEYCDVKRRVYPITERVTEHDDRSEVEQDILAELFKIFGKK